MSYIHKFFAVVPMIDRIMGILKGHDEEFDIMLKIHKEQNKRLDKLEKIIKNKKI